MSDTVLDPSIQSIVPYSPSFFFLQVLYAYMYTFLHYPYIYSDKTFNDSFQILGDEQLFYFWLYEAIGISFGSQSKRKLSPRSYIQVNLKLNVNLFLWVYTCHLHVYLTRQRNLFEILLNQTKIRLYLPFSDWFGTKRTFFWFQLNWKMVNKIWFRFDLIRFRKDFSVCIVTVPE